MKSSARRKQQAAQKPAPSTKRKPHRFQRGNAYGGRKSGAKNKITIKLQDAIMTACELCGQNGRGKDGAVGYLMRLAMKEPEVFGRLLLKLLPYQIQGTVGGRIALELRDGSALLRAFRERGLPLPEEVFRGINKDIPKMIELKAQDVVDEEERKLEGDDDEVDEAA